jgi:phosphoribosylamine--glycine ligase
LDEAEIDWSDDYAVSVVLTSAGSPGKYATGKLITGVEEAEEREGVTVYHAGDKMHMENPPQKPSDPVGEEFLVTSGGRVLDVTAVAPTFEEARARAYEACELINFEGKTLRHDIGERALRGRDAWEI